MARSTMLGFLETPIPSRFLLQSPRKERSSLLGFGFESFLAPATALLRLASASETPMPLRMVAPSPAALLLVPSELPSRSMMLIASESALEMLNSVAPWTLSDLA
mmetsp:Transcript_3317/g.9148  ORF Transcript_3317/g.9148 Transcript_3317/m.9148 type:complete len:105 (+) Transcript_3317:705-1019(+)